MDYGVVYLGVSGYGPQQEIVRLKEYVKKIGAPHYILLLVCDNDVQDEKDFLSDAIHKKLLEGNPRYYSFVVHWLLWLKFDTEIGKCLVYMAKVRRRQQEMSNHQNSAEKLIPDYQELVNYSRKYGATLIISWIPINNLPTITPREYLGLQEYCRQHDVAFADWFPMVQTIRENIPALPYVNSHSAGHYRTWVNTMIAKAFAEQIRLYPLKGGH